MSHPSATEKGQVDELKNQNSSLSTQLLDLEIQLVEQLEEFSKYGRREGGVRGEMRRM